MAEKEAPIEPNWQPTALVWQVCGDCGFRVNGRSLDAVRSAWHDHDWYRQTRRVEALPSRRETDA